MNKKSFLGTLIISLIFFVTQGFTIEPGQKASDFTINNYDGNSYHLYDIKDAEAIVIMFWSTECPYVQPYTERINKLASEYQQKKVVFWAINSNSTESVEEVINHKNKNGYVFPMLKDENNVVADLFGATRTPEVFVLSKDFVVLYHGRIDDNRDESKVNREDLKIALDEILAGKEVSTKITKQFGCTIKRVEK